MAGAGIEYYDIALYTYMAPILTPLFLPDIPKTQAYFYFFLFEFFAALAQVAGASFFGNIGDRKGRKKPMYYAMLGTSLVTFSICVLPTYQTAGITATFLFVIARCSQSFFLGGEYNGGIIYCLEHEKDRAKHNIISGLYCSLTVVGIVAASIIALSINHSGSEYWRVAYVISFILAIFTFSYRRKITETPEFLESKIHDFVQPPQKLFKRLFESEFTSIVVMAVFFGILYGIPTRIFNALLPLAIDITTNQFMLINSIFLFIYMILLFVFGFLASKYGTRKIMSTAIMATILLSMPLMFLVEAESVEYIIIAKAIFAILAAAFMGPFHAWTQSLFAVNKRYKSISMAYAVGKCFSTLILACSVLVFDYFQTLSSLGVILLIAACGAWVKYNSSKEKTQNPIHNLD